jgi:Domain of unknown function (DUF5666)
MLAAMQTTKLIPAALAALALGGTATATATAAGAQSAAARHLEGRVVSVDRTARTFRLRDAERGTVRIRVTRSTDFERISGFAALRAGMRRVEATVRRSNGRWVATHVERSGGGGEHGGHGGGRDHPEDD